VDVENLYGILGFSSMERKKEGSLELIFKSHLGNEFTNAETRIGVARSPGKKSPGRPLSSASPCSAP
jgi:hypothetical protein